MDARMSRAAGARRAKPAPRETRAARVRTLGIHAKQQKERGTIFRSFRAL